MNKPNNSATAENVGIIGAGNMGSMLAEYFAYLGYTVSIANSGRVTSLKSFEQRTGIKAVAVEQVVQNKNIVVVALPVKAINKLPPTLFSVVDSNTIVIDTGNYFPGVRDEIIPAIEEGLTESEWVSQQLGVPVIKAFNNMTALSFATSGLPSATPGRLCIPIAGDNSGHKQTLLRIIDKFGFDAIDTGVLSESWKQQPGAPAYCADVDKIRMMEILQHSERKKIGAYRKAMMAGAREAIKQFGSLEAAVATTGRPEILTFINK